MKRLIILLIFVLVITFTVQGQGTIFDTYEEEPLISMLSLIPIGSESVAYIDLQALENAGQVPATVGDFSEIEADSVGARLWLWRSNRLVVGNFPMFQSLFVGGELFPETVGFDFFDIDRLASFGLPPQTGQIFQGDFDLEAVEAAHTARDYTRENIRGLRAWCAPEGCDSGLMIDVQTRTTGNIFDPQLGRKPPVISYEDYLLSAYDFGVVQTMASTVQADFRSLAESPAHRAIADAVTDAELFPGDVIQLLYVDQSETLDVDLSVFGSREDYTYALENNLVNTPLAEQWQMYSALPVYEQAAFVDYHDGENQKAVIAVAYRTQATAEAGAEELGRRIATFSDEMVRRQTEPIVNNVLDASVDAPQIYTSARTGMFVVLVSVTYPLQDDLGASISRGDQRPGILYHNWVSSYYRRSFYPLWHITLPAWARGGV
ncbi:MAG: hypothetical protein OHK0046_19920 [Anaerolineae bacterium]